MKQGDSDVLIKNTIPNFPNDLVPKKGKEEVRVEDNKSFFIPVLIKLLAYHSSFFAIIVKNLSSFNAVQLYFREAN
ncbi:MAG: hypothetical protein IPH52_17925 [Leptospiraceae bacterium]|nr:hypothetical protein [Leptospiraceae bacterium]